MPVAFAAHKQIDASIPVNRRAALETKPASKAANVASLNNVKAMAIVSATGFVNGGAAVVIGAKRTSIARGLESVTPMMACVDKQIGVFATSIVTTDFYALMKCVPSPAPLDHVRGLKCVMNKQVSVPKRIRVDRTSIVQVTESVRIPRVSIDVDSTRIAPARVGVRPMVAVKRAGSAKRTTTVMRVEFVMAVCVTSPVRPDPVLVIRSV